MLVPRWEPESQLATVGIGFLAQRQPLIAVLGVELEAALSLPAGLCGCDGCAYPYTADQEAAARPAAVLS